MHKSKSHFTNYKRILAFAAQRSECRKQTMQRREKTIVKCKHISGPQAQGKRAKGKLVKEFSTFY
jgi:hypothetical protein